MNDARLIANAGLRKAAAKIGVVATRARTTKPVREFADRLWPRQTEHPLIRIGGKGDGGYLVPDDLDGVTVCFSPGVAETAQFEQQMLQRGIKCFLSDASVSRAPISDPKLVFQKKFLGVTNDQLYCTLESWVEDCTEPNGGEFILQMDIEGAEFASILATPQNTLLKFRILVLEVHHLDGIFSELGFKVIDAFFRKIERDFQLVHAHPNNSAPRHVIDGIRVPEAIELTYLRRDRIKKLGSSCSLPNLLDSRCVDDLPEIMLADCLSASIA